MADLSGIQQTLDRLTSDLKSRDEGLRQAFGIMTEGLLRMQAVMDDIHAAATKEIKPSGIPALLAEIKRCCKRSQPRSPKPSATCWMIASCSPIALARQERHPPPSR